MDLLTPADAAALAGVSTRSLRKWAATGRLSRRRGPDGRPRYDRAEVLAARTHPELQAEPLPESIPELRGAGGTASGIDSAELDELRRRLDGAQRAARAAAIRMGASRLELAAERARGAERAAELEYLRARLVEAERAAEQERVLHQAALRSLEAEQARAQALEAERRALLATTAPRRPWWAPWRR